MPKFLIAAALAIVISIPAFARPPAHQTLRQSFQALYNKTDAAFDRKNLQGSFGPLDPKYVQYDQDGKAATLAQCRQWVAQKFKTCRFLRDTTTVLSVSVFGNSAIVVIRSTESYLTTDKFSHGPLQVYSVETDQDEWVKSGAAWKLRKESCLSYSYWENGKQME